MSEFTIKDSGARQEFSGGMVRDTTEGKVNFLNVRIGPMLRRWATHLTKGREKYPDPMPGVPNWTLASGVEEYLRAKESAARHFEQWLAGDRDEDHAAGVFFNINLAEYVRDRIGEHPGLGVTPPHELDVHTPAPDAEQAGMEETPWTPEVGARVRVVSDDQFNGNRGEVVPAPEYAVVPGWECWVKLPAGVLGFNKDELEPA